MPCDAPPETDPFEQTAALEAKWQKLWQESGCFKAGRRKGAERFYNFDGGPFPNGALHMGHVRTFVLGDVMARYQRLRGRDVLYCFEFDAFGLPNELAAEKQGVAPRALTAVNIERMRAQMIALGLSYDWDHVHNTCDPRYYRWTQWLFLKLWQAGLVYQAEAELNWCPACRTTLAHIQVENGKCWRCETPVETRSMTQWYVALSTFSARLHESLDHVGGFGPQVRKTLAGFIGAADGYEIDLQVVGAPELELTAFIDAGKLAEPAAFVALAPRHPLARESKAPAASGPLRRHTRNRPQENHGISGWNTGLKAVDPRTGRTLPVFIADHVDANFAGGATLGFPGSVPRDRAFAEAHGIAGCHREDTVDTKASRKATHFRVRDWLVSRQRAWGTPIPFVHCAQCGTRPVAEPDLPVILPDPPAGGLRNGLADLGDFVTVACPACGGAAQRETDTLDCYFDVIWCFLACSGRLDENFAFRREDFARWMPVDWFHNGLDSFFYMHLYRFLGHVLHDMGVLDDPEPFANYAGHNVVSLDGRKMSKHHGNVINPDAVLRSAGADVLRVHVVWSANPNKGFEWSDDGLERARNLLKAVWSLNERARASDGDRVADAGADAETRASRALRASVARTVRRSTGLLEKYQFSGVLTEIHRLTLALKPAAPDRNPAMRAAFRDGCDCLIRLLAPFAPHLAEEAWSRNGHTTLLADAPAWPEPEELRTREPLMQS
ncbi:MAG: leucine--tRNA ligase [Roseibium sp.]